MRSAKRHTDLASQNSAPTDLSLDTRSLVVHRNIYAISSESPHATPLSEILNDPTRFN